MNNPLTKHTPGPWDWRDIDDLRQAKSTRTDGRYGESVLYASYDYDRGPYLETTDANRALIAAAPDLLEACIQAAISLRAVYGLLPYQTCSEVILLDDAIAKATKGTI